MDIRSMKSLSAVPAVAVTLTLALAGCAKEDTSTTTDSGIKLVDKGTLTICTHLPYEPFEYTEGGKTVGFDPDVLKIAADANDLKTKVIDISWETNVSGEALNTGKCDVAAGAMTITPERENVMDFTDPYFEATQALMTKKGSGISSLDQLAGKTVAVQDATTGADYVKKNAPDDTKIISFEDSALMGSAVRTGKADAGVNDNGLLAYYVSQNPDDVEVTTEFQTGEKYGFSVKKGGNQALLDAINKGIASPEYDKVYKKWFGKDPS
jgi:polar amino acid transport system substrate-binding protein